MDEAALSQVREMALSVKEEVVNAVPSTGCSGAAPGVPISMVGSSQPPRNASPTLVNQHHNLSMDGQQEVNFNFIMFMLSADVISTFSFIFGIKLF